MRLPTSNSLSGHRVFRGFTIIEMMLAIGIFAMALASIYASWSAVLRGVKLAQDATAATQRTRVAVRAIEDALSTTEIFSANPHLYYFVADTKGEYAALEMVARLPDSFPGSGMYGDQMVRHVAFTVEPGDFSRNQLVLRQWPLLMPRTTANPAYEIVLGRDVDQFKLEFYDPVKKDWIDEWTYTNQVPPLVKVSIGMGNGRNVPVQEREIFTRIVAIPTVVVPPDWQMPIPTGRPGAPGFNPNPNVPGNPNNPNNPNNPINPVGGGTSGFNNPIRR